MKVVLLVLDGLGAGAMADTAEARLQDQRANTLKHVAEAVGGLNLPTLSALGLGCIQSAPSLESPAVPLASYGRANLGYMGADSYLGHQELMGTTPILSEFTLMSQASAEIEAALLRAGYRVRRFPEDGSMLIVNEAVVIADNLEADAGQNINLTVALAHITFDEALRIGRIVRELVKVTRVIVFGGPGLTLKRILAHVEQHGAQRGINSPALGVYDENLIVRHLGYGVDPERQVASILVKAGMRVSLIGKMADLIVCPAACRNPVVPTDAVMDAILDDISNDTFDFVAATVQETDLAGHEGDAERYAAVLRQADSKLAELLPLLGADDVLIITADHGNDPTLGLGTHTREQVPVLLYRPDQPACELQDRSSLADIAATVSTFFGVDLPQDGAAIQLLQHE